MLGILLLVVSAQAAPRPEVPVAQCVLNRLSPEERAITWERVREYREGESELTWRTFWSVRSLARTCAPRAGAEVERAVINLVVNRVVRDESAAMLRRMGINVQQIDDWLIRHDLDQLDEQGPDAALEAEIRRRPETLARDERGRQIIRMYVDAVISLMPVERNLRAN